MWKLLRMLDRIRQRAEGQTTRRESRIPQLCVSELVSLCHRASERPMIFDLRAPPEVEEHPYVIPGALLTIHVDLYALVPWIPPDTLVVLYAAANVPAHRVCTHQPSAKLRFYALEGGLRFWRDAGQPVERVALGDWRPVDI